MNIHQHHAVNNLILGMQCDGYGPEGRLRCGVEPTWSPRVVIPAMDDNGEPLRIMTRLHFCDMHFYSFDQFDWLTRETRRRIERDATKVRRSDFRPDFGRAFVQRVRIRTPEYREYLTKFLRVPAY